MANPLGLIRNLVATVACLSVCCGAARAQQTVVTFEPATTKITFTLGATLHSVRGTFQLKRGEMRFDHATGNASGEIVVDATSGNSENSDRDKKMHKDVLESGKYSEIVFVPSHVNEAISIEKTGNVEVAGVMRLHGQEHPMTLTMTVSRAANGDLQGSTHFTIPYVKWGMKNPSTFILRVSENVDVDVQATAHVR